MHLLAIALAAGLNLISVTASAVEPPGSGVTDTPAHVPDYRLTIKVNDESGAPTAARVSVTVESGGFEIPPENTDVPFYQPPGTVGYFYAERRAVVRVPPGAVRILVSKGPEYDVADRVLNITANRTEIVNLQRVTDARTFGWFSGDTHVHIEHGGVGAVYEISNQDLALVADAEDLHLTCALTNGTYFNGGIDAASTPEHLLHFGLEYRSAVYGHMAVLGLQELLPSGCCLPGTPAAPLNRQVALDAHEQGAVAIASHPLTTSVDDFLDPSLSWPFSGMGREIPADVILGGLDAFDVYSYSNYNRDAVRKLWFDLLDLGYRLPLSVGTDAAINRSFDPPMGGSRVYVQCGNTLTLEKWLDGLGEGHSFATNGPLPLNFEIANQGPGDVWVRESTELTVSGDLLLASRQPVQRLEIWSTGGIRIASYLLPAFTDQLSFPFTVTVPPEATWIVARLTGPNPDDATIGFDLEALTSPIWIESNSAVTEPRPAAADRFDEWLQDLRTILVEREVWNSETERKEILAEIQRARQLIAPRNRADDPENEVPQRTRAEAVGAPDVVAEHGTFRLRVPGRGSGRLEVFDVQGRRVFEGPPLPLPGPFSWTREDRLGHVRPGVYFLRVRTPEGVSSARRIVLLP